VDARSSSSCATDEAPFFLPIRSVHSIGADATLLEQQNVVVEVKTKTTQGANSTLLSLPYYTMLCSRFSVMHGTAGLMEPLGPARGLSHVFFAAATGAVAEAGRSDDWAHPHVVGGL
jgi:hypothetical protein